MAEFADPTCAAEHGVDCSPGARLHVAQGNGAEHTCETLEIECARVRGPWTLEIGSPHGANSYTLEPGQRLTLGSSRAASVRIEDRAVSGRHCAVFATELGVTVEDLGSKNGLFVGAARVVSATLAASGSDFVIGRTIITVRREFSDDSISAQESLPGVIGSSAPMRRVAREIRRHARMRVPVLLQGESGTGKDVVARALHVLGRRSGAYVPLNVAALSESLCDAELFGHRRGAFTGAVASRTGAFEQAHKGTLFLDEVADLSPAVQIKLLRVVEDGLVRPVGSMEPVSVDVRIVSASWASLPERVAADRFRADLYHRLSTVVVFLPPLRERKSDLSVLATSLLARMRDDVGPKRLSSAALARLAAHDWPGNVRELMSVLYRGAVASDDVEIGGIHVEIFGAAKAQPQIRTLSAEQARELLERHAGNISAAARAARVARSTFRSWLERAQNRPTTCNP